MGYLALIAVGTLLLGIVAGVVTTELLSRPQATPAEPAKHRSVRIPKPPLEGSPAEAAAAAFRSFARKSK